MSKLITRLTGLFICMSFVLVGCGPETNTEAGDDHPVLLFAAASTQEALAEIISEFSADGGTTVQASFASSAALARQIEAGADAAIFVSASVEWVDYLEQHGFVAEERAFLSNKLVLIVPASSQLEIGSPNDLLQSDVRHVALADPFSVPAGRYAKEALIGLGLWDDLESKVAPGADVRQALFYVARGEADAGIVYVTDARMTEKVRVAAELDAALSTPVRYVVALMDGHDQDSRARQLYDYLNSEKARAVFERYGFTLVQENE